MLHTSRERLKNLTVNDLGSVASRLPRTDSKVLPCNHGHWPKNGRSSSAAPIKSASGWWGGTWATLGLGKLAGMAFKCVSKTRMLRETPGASWSQSWKIAGMPRRFFKSSLPSSMKTKSVCLSLLLVAALSPRQLLSTGSHAVPVESFPHLQLKVAKNPNKLKLSCLHWIHCKDVMMFEVRRCCW